VNDPATESREGDCAHPPHPEGCAHAPPEVVERAAAIFRAASDPGRLRLLERLASQEHCVSELAAEAGDSMSTISQRLRLLRAGGLVRRRREGKHVFYGLADAHVAELIQSALDHAREEGTS